MEGAACHGVDPRRAVGPEHHGDAILREGLQAIKVRRGRKQRGCEVLALLMNRARVGNGPRRGDGLQEAKGLEDGGGPRGKSMPNFKLKEAGIERTGQSLNLAANYLDILSLRILQPALLAELLGPHQVACKIAQIARI